VAGSDPTDAPDDDDDDASLADLRHQRPAPDAIDHDAVRARAERALFGAAELARVGRYVLIDRLASGGMGTVYSAFDPQLDRKVAIKLIHPRQIDAERARARALAEARTLALLDHPNVVPVHDVLELDAQIAIVMELVAGSDLAAWERARPRSWRELVAVYVEAGRGLAAAHKLGIAHRDFKPHNVVVGVDRRVRVLDFGVAGVVHAAVAPTLPRDLGLTGRLEVTLTDTGEALGTIAYMAPEQLRGEAATPASDQWSFCVALHRALFGVAPFPGTNVDELRASIEVGRIDYGRARGRVPAWLRAVLARGLARDPSARHRSMEAVLAQLARVRGWRRWRLPLVATIAVAATAVALYAWTRPRAATAVVPCDGGARELAAVWNPTRALEVRAALTRAATPYARAIESRVVTELDGYSAAWSSGHLAACTAGRRGAESPTRIDIRMRCLHRRLDELAAATAALTALDAASASRAMDVVAGMAPVADCADDEVLAAEVEPPPGAAARAAVAALSQRLSHAQAIERAGHSGDAIAATTAVLAEARELDYPPLLIDALLTLGRTHLQRTELAAARAPLAEAEERALASGLLGRAVVAGARRLYVDNGEGRGGDGLLAVSAVLEPLSRGVRGDHLARPLLLNTIALLHLTRGDRTKARSLLEQARAERDRDPDPDLELTAIDLNLALLTSEPGARAAIARDAWQRRRARLGEANLLTLQAQYMAALATTDADVAAAANDEAVAALRQFHPDAGAAIAEWSYLAAQLALVRGDAATAAARYREVAALPVSEVDATLWRDLAAGWAAFLDGDDHRALSAVAPVLRRSVDHAAWWERLIDAEALVVRGRAQARLGDLAAARADLSTAIEALTEGLTHVEHLGVRLRRDEATAALATLTSPGSAPGRSPP